MAKIRVYDLAREFGVDSKAVMDQLKEMGEFVRSASSPLEAPVVRRLKDAFEAKQPVRRPGMPVPSTGETPRVDRAQPPNTEEWHEEVWTEKSHQAEDRWQQFAQTHQIGQVLPGLITKLTRFGVFVRIAEGVEGLVRISELADRHVASPGEVVQVGDEIFVKIIDIDLNRRRISLSLKQVGADGAGEAIADFDDAYGTPTPHDELDEYPYQEDPDPGLAEWRGIRELEELDDAQNEDRERGARSADLAGGGDSSGGLASGRYVSPDLPHVRYLTGDLPERAPVGRRISLLVRITLAAPAGTTAATLGSLGVPAGGRDVTVTVSAPDLLPLGDLEQDLHVPAVADSDPIRFGFRTGRAGLHRVIVSAFANGTFLGELPLQISVEIGADLEEGPSHTAVLAGLTAEPGEVTLQVSRTDEDRYSFQLIGEALYPVELTKRLAGDPTEVVGALVGELRAMAAGSSPFTTSTLVRNRIRNLGAQLWADVVPEAIRRQFWAQADRIKLFTVASDMDTVPWELLYPVDGDNDNGFLVEQFPVVRRVYGQGRARRLSLASAAYVVPPGSPRDADNEVEAVRAQLGEDIRDYGVVERLDLLIALLEGAPSILHFACHNQFTDQAGSVLNLAGGPLRPSDLAVAVQKHGLAAASPLVFFNACRTAGEIPGLMQMIGWAKQFMSAGAGAFLGSLWAVRSGSARTFADAFYRALVTEGNPLGTASLRARQAIAEDGGDPTWLAYTVYGNPSATIGNGTAT